MGPAKPWAYPRLGSRLSVVLVTVGAVLFPIALLTTWADQTISSQSRYVATVGPLIDNDQVQQSLADSITTALLDQVDVDRLLEDVLERSDQPLRTDQVAGLREFLRAEIIDLLNTPQTRAAWERVNAELQTRLIAALRGESNPAVVIETDAIVLDTGFVLDEVQTLLVERGFSPVEQVSLSDSADRRIVLLRGDQVGTVASGYRVLDDVAPWLLVLSVLVLAGGVAVDTDRRRSLVRASASVVVGCLTLAVVLLVARIAALSVLDAGRGVESAVFDTVTRSLWLLIATVAVTAGAVAFTARRTTSRSASPTDASSVPSSPAHSGN